MHMNSAAFMCLLALALAVSCAEPFPRWDVAPPQGNGVAASAYQTKILADGEYVFTDGSSIYPLMSPEEYERSRAAVGPPQVAADSGLGTMSQNVVSTPSSYSLRPYQTSVKDQLGREVCWAFGGVSAVEAFYKRVYGVELDLSEGYAVHFPRMAIVQDGYLKGDNWEAGSSWWGGAGGANSVLEATRYGRLPEERYAPFMSRAQQDILKDYLLGPGPFAWQYNPLQEQIDLLEFREEHIPDVARLNARYGVDSYTIIPAASTSDLVARLESAIADNHEVVGVFYLHWSFDSAGNQWVWNPSQDAGVHVMLIVAYDRDQQVFTLKNSWGTGDPNLTWVRVSYEFVKNAFAEGAYINAVVPPTPPVQARDAWLGEWVLGFGERLFIRRVSDGCRRSDCRVKIGDYYDPSGAKHEVEGYVAENGDMSFYVGPTGVRLIPGLGQPQYVDSNSATLSLTGSGSLSAPIGSFLLNSTKRVVLDRQTRHGGLVVAQLVASVTGR